MFVKIFTDILSNQISFRVVTFFFIVFLILNNTILILKKNLVLKDYRPVLMVFYFQKIEFYIQFYYQFFMS